MKKSHGLVVASLALSSFLTFAAGNGSAPKGKPFVAINDQIIEIEGTVASLQDQIDTLVARVDTIEDRVGANEDAIQLLSDQNAALAALISQNTNDIQLLQNEVVALQQANTDLQAQISANAGDIDALSTQVAYNDALITTLQSAIITIQNNAIAVEQGLQSQIDNNTSLIGILQSEIDSINTQLQLKQNLVNGVCPNGSAVKQVLTDGSVICEAFSGVSGQLQSIYAYQYERMNPNSYASVRATCPNGYTATAAGFSTNSRVNVYANYTGYNSNSQNWGYVAAFNDNSYYSSLYSVTTCTRIAP